MKTPVLLLGAVLLLTGCANTENGETPAAAPAASILPAYYAKRKDIGGVTVSASERVSVDAIGAAVRIAQAMTAGNETIRTTLASGRVRIAIVGVAESVTDLPERTASRPRRYYDIYRRSAAGTRSDPLITIGEENLLGYPGDPAAGENLLAKTIAETCLALIKDGDASFAAAMDAAYAGYLRQRPPSDLPPLSLQEYRGAGVAAWFGASGSADRALLQRTDPALAKLLEDAFGSAPLAVAAAKTDDTPGVPRFARSPEEIAWAARYLRGEETLAPVGTVILPMLPPGLHRSLRPGYIKDWKSPEKPGAATKLYFANNSDIPVRISLLGTDGKPVTTDTVYQGGHLEPDTTAGTVWKVTDAASGRALGYTIAADKPALRVIRNAEDEDKDFDEDGELDTYTPYPMQLVRPSERTRWSSGEQARDAMVFFVNDSKRTVVLEGLDRGGVTLPLGRLRPGDNISLATFADQVWRVRETDGTILGYVISSYKPAALRITDDMKPLL